MRVVLIGFEAARRRIRALLPEDMEVVGEASTIESARATGLDADAWLLAAQPASEQDGRVGAAAEALTRREQEVLERLADGMSNRAIAAALDISDQTVKFHVASICGKLGAANRTEAVRRALRLGLLAL
jgi:ATP/maltotriose-dependent transcriptional regulator MalT